MATEVALATVRDVTVKFAVAAPAAIVTLAGTVATLVLALERATVAPPAGAALESVTVPCDELPPMTVVGLSVRDVRLVGGGGGGTGVTASVAVRVTLLKVAEIVTLFVAVTETVLMENVALVAPAATMTFAGVEATAGVPLDKVTTAPPLGAALLRVTVP